METSIVQYVHSKKKNRSGPLRAVVIAQVRPENPNEVGIGWAMARRKDGKQVDQFSKSMGVLIASGRAANFSKESAPHSLKEDIENVTQRAINYFKDKKVVPVTKFSEPKPEDLSHL